MISDLLLLVLFQIFILASLAIPFEMLIFFDTFFIFVRRAIAYIYFVFIGFDKSLIPIFSLFCSHSQLQGQSIEFRRPITSSLRQNMDERP